MASPPVSPPPPSHIALPTGTRIRGHGQDSTANVSPEQAGFETGERFARFAMESCLLKSILAGCGGFVMGMAMGVMFAPLETTQAELAAQNKGWKDQFRATGIAMKTKSTEFGRSFGKIGFLFAGSECVIEKARGSHDMYNSVGAGCFTGGVLARSGGPQSMVAGCAAFAAFSAAIDTAMSKWGQESISKKDREAMEKDYSPESNDEIEARISAKLHRFK